MKNLILLVFLLLFGCSSITQVRDYDGEKMSEQEMSDIIHHGGVVYTEDVVVLMDEKDIKVTAIKRSPSIIFEKDYQVEQDKWAIHIRNFSDDNVCVSLQWKLMDFKFISNYPSEFYLKSNDRKIIGEMVQMIWEIEGVKFTPVGSGFIYSMEVREPIENYKEFMEEDRCLYITKEKDIVTK